MRNMRFALASASALVVSTLALTSGGAAAASRSVVPQGLTRAVTTNSTVFGNTPANTPVTVSIILTTRNTYQLHQFIQNTVTPGNPQFRRFLTTQQFAQQYGQGPEVIQSIVNYFQQYGITASVYPDNLDITLNGTAGQFDQAFNIQLQNMEHHHQRFHAPNHNPTMPSNLAGPILAVLGLTNYAPFSSTAVHTSPAVMAKAPNAFGNNGTTPTGVTTPTQFQSLYNISGLTSQGDLGQGQTLGIVTLASVNPSDAYAFWNAYGIKTTTPNAGNRISLVNIDGGAGAPSLAAGSDETTLDVEQSGAVAPDANIIVYQAPNTDYGFVDAYARAISDNQVGSLSASWGLSETAVNYAIQTGQESPNYAQAFDEMYQEAAAQGISTFTATGDYGAYQAVSDLGTTNLAVGNPADSPYVTAAGGTTLPSIYSSILPQIGVTITQQRAWGWDYLFPLWNQFGAPNEQAWAQQNIGGSNGGYSVIFPEPYYQRGIRGVNHYHAVQWFTPINNNTAWSFNASAPVVQGSSNGGRAMPDLAMNADPYTGYAIYSTLFTPSSGLANTGLPNWSAGWGGTSFVAPQLNGVAALINTKAGGRVGFWNPQIYSFARQQNSPFTPLDATGSSNDNLYYSGTAGTIYNPATGLGTPNVAALAQDFIQEGSSQGFGGFGQGGQGGQGNNY